jgi:hypothetical protein
LLRRVAFLGFSLLACRSADVSAVELLCADSGIMIQGTELQDVRDGCAAARSAAAFFGIAGLSMPKGVTVDLVDSQCTSVLAAHEMGNYDAEHNSIRVLAFQPAATEGMRAEPGLGRIASRDHWRSYIVHELTHAAIHLGCDKTCPSRAIHEYIAAVAQLSSLPERTLADLLNHYRDLEAFRQLSEVTETYYEINPHFFAVKSYKHYRQLSDPQAFFRNLLRPAD